MRRLLALLAFILMPDLIGRISVPTPVASSAVFPLASDFGYGMSRDWPIIAHRFGELASLSEQRFQVGVGPRKFAFRRSVISYKDRLKLLDFFDTVQGSFQSFLYDAPLADKTTERVRVVFENQPLSIDHLTHWCQSGFNLIECPDSADAPSYPVHSTCLRFPSEELSAALLNQVQRIIPLVHIRPREVGSTVNQAKALDDPTRLKDIWLSDRRVILTATDPDIQSTMGWLDDAGMPASSQAYLPRLLNMGEPGSDVIMTQDIKGTADNVQFAFGNADRAMTALANDCDLKYASIDLCLYHVNTGILIQLWKGFITNFVVDGSAEFRVQASDGLFQVMQQYPARIASRTCWKTFDDGLNCPYATKGSGGDPTSCDFLFDSANGCLAHNMQQYFGGIPASPQGANVKDNSTGGPFGFGRNTVTATSIIAGADSLWGSALQEIWCNDDGDPGRAYIANCLIAAIRDESDFVDGLGIVGAGPIGQFTGMLVYQNADGYRFIIAPMLDGQTPHGFKVDSQLNVKSDSTLGLREVEGTDPTDQSATDDRFAMSAGGTINVQNRAAGVAFVDMRRTDAAGIQPSTPIQHQMTVPISKGLSGRVWDAGGGSSWVGGLTNPFWIAVNSYLRTLGLGPQETDSSDRIAAQLAMFTLPSLANSETYTLPGGGTAMGTGTAQIADLPVAPLVGTATTEPQFRFQGVLAQQKAFRDWLNEILFVGVGYFTFEFGKLTLGIRENAGAVSAFTLGNTIYQSLRLEPIEATFQHTIIDFANRDIQFQADIAEYQDKSHAAYYGNLTVSRIHSVGCSTLSQGARIAAVRTREEIGGVDATEWKNARNAFWKTTILALETGVGKVVSQTHPDIPGISGTADVSGTSLTWVSGSKKFDVSLTDKEILIDGVEVLVAAFVDAEHLTLSVDLGVISGAIFKIVTADFRIQRWQFFKDYSIGIDGRTVTASMYDLEVGPKPIDVAPDPLPALFYPIPLGEWAPFQAQYPENDALFPSEYTFDLMQNFLAALSGGSSEAAITVTGKLPINGFLPDCGAPVVVAGNVTQDAVGGNIPGGKTFRISICATSPKGFSPPSRVLILQTADVTDANQFTLSGILWPKIEGLTGYSVFISDKDDLICHQQDGILLPGDDPTTYAPTDITVAGPFARSTWGLPNPNIKKVRIKAKRLLHGGVLGAQVNSSSGNQIIAGEAADLTSVDNWVGRYAIPIGRPNDLVPALSFQITGYDPLTGAILTVPDCVVDGHPESSVLADDVFVISTLGVPNDANPYIISDPGLSNAANYSQDPVTGEITPTPHSGLTTSAERGYVLRVIVGKSRGLTAKILDNDATSYTLDSPIPIDETSVWIIESAAWEYSIDSADVGTVDPDEPTTVSLPTPAYLNQAMLVSGFPVDVNGSEPPDGDAPVRMLRFFGSANAPAQAPFEVTDEREGYLVVDNLKITDNIGVGSIKLMNFVAPSIDETDTNWRGGITIGEDDITFLPVFSGASRFPSTEDGGGRDWRVGQFFQVQDYSNAEIMRIKSINDDGTWTVDRAQFGTIKTAHTAHFYWIGRPRVLGEPTREDMTGTEPPTTVSGIQDRYAWPIPAHSISVVRSQAVGEFGNSAVYDVVQSGPWSASQPHLGKRTHRGRHYVLKIDTGEDLAVGDRSDELLIRDWEAPRVAFADVQRTPPVAGSDPALIAILYFKDPDGNYGLIDYFLIASGATSSYSDNPGDREMPYHAGAWVAPQLPPYSLQADWPTQTLCYIEDLFVTGVFNPAYILRPTHAPVIFQRGGRIGMVIQQVGATTPGSDLLGNLWT